MQKELIWAKTEADWNEHCGTGFRGICSIGIFNGASDAPGVEALKGVMAELGRLGAAFRFLAVDGACQHAFASRFDAQFENLPALAAYSSSKARYALYSGAFKEDGLKTFLNSILSGKSSTISIPQRPEFSTSCDVQPSEEVISESNEDKADADDVMAEIRREEAERKAQVKKEMEEEAKRKREEEEQATKPKVIKKVVKKVVKKKKKKSETGGEL